jgi:FixJ family two-component response regulator
LATLTSDEQDVLARLITGKTIGTISNELREPAEAVAVGRARALSKLKCSRLAEVMRLTLTARWLN